MIIAVDFDGTIVEHQFPEIGDPIEKAFEVLLELKSEGHKLILWTCRNGDDLKAAIDFCSDRGLEFNAVNENIPDHPYVHLGYSRKVYADIYVDDKAQLPIWEIFAL